MNNSKGASEQFRERGKTQEPKTTTTTTATTTTATPTLALGGSEQRSPAELLGALSSHNIRQAKHVSDNHGFLLQ